MEGSYLYFIYRNDVPSPVYLIGKVGRGTGPRYKHYTTAYGTNYDVHIVVPSACYKAAEKDLLEWCRGKGYVRTDAETIDMPTMSDDMAWKDIKTVYMNIVTAIKDRMSIYGSVWHAYVGGKKTSLCCIADAPETTWTVPVVEEKVVAYVPPVIDMNDALRLYAECIGIRGYDLSWKHAEKIFHDRWCGKDTQMMVKGCVHGRQQYLEYAARYKMALDDGMDAEAASTISLPPDVDSRDAVTRYGILMKIKRMASIEYADGMHRWRFKASLRKDPAWHDIMRRSDRRFGIHVMDKGTCHHNMWQMLSTLFTKEYGIIHTMDDERVGRGQERWWVYSFGSDDALVDVG